MQEIFVIIKKLEKLSLFFYNSKGINAMMREHAVLCVKIRQLYLSSKCISVLKFVFCFCDVYELSVTA